MPRKNQNTPPSDNTNRIMPVEFKPQSKSKIHTAGFLALLIATAVAICAIYFLPGYGIKDFLANDDQKFSTVTHKTADKSDTTDANKTYKNSTYGFEFQYPSSYVVKGDFDKDKSISIQTENTNLGIEFINKPIVLVRGDIADQYEGKITSAKDIKFNGNDSREIVFCDDGICSRFILIARSNGTLKITHLYSTDSVLVNSFNNILSTFKFTN